MMAKMKEYIVLELLLTIKVINVLCNIEDKVNCDIYCHLQDRCGVRLGNASYNNDSLDTFVSYLDIPCPPPGQLHHVCGKNNSTELTTCDERVLIIDRCVQRFPGIYNDSLWSKCLHGAFKCDEVVKYLVSIGFIDIGVSETTVINSVTSSSKVTSEPVTHSSDSATSNGLDTTSSVTTSTQSSETSKTEVTDSTENRTLSTTTMVDSAIATSNSNEAHPPLSVLYPLIGSLVILLEVAVLCTWFCYKKRKEKTAAQQGSLVQQEEVIEPETASPTKALRPNNVDAETVKTEDEKIYRSYINLKYIDESVESTPEKVALRT